MDMASSSVDIHGLGSWMGKSIAGRDAQTHEIITRGSGYLRTFVESEPPALK